MEFHFSYHSPMIFSPQFIGTSSLLHYLCVSSSPANECKYTIKRCMFFTTANHWQIIRKLKFHTEFCYSKAATYHCYHAFIALALIKHPNAILIMIMCIVNRVFLLMLNFTPRVHDFYTWHVHTAIYSTNTICTCQITMTMTFAATRSVDIYSFTDWELLK